MSYQLNQKNGIDFTLSASIIWLVIAYLWTLKFKAYDRSVLVFIAGAPTSSNGTFLFQDTKDQLENHK